MKIFTDSNSFIPVFDGEVPFCRNIDDRLIIFDRLGEVITSRSEDALPAVGSNFFDCMPESEAGLIADFCLSFEYDTLIVDTDFGGAMVFTSTLGASGLMFAVIPHAPKAAVFEYFKENKPRRVLLSDIAGAESSATPSKCVTSAVGDIFTMARSVFSTDLMRASIYRMGTHIGGFISEKLLEIANFTGCVGDCHSALNVLPDTEHFCPEIFIAMCICITVFARNTGKERSFKALIGESCGRILTSFCIDTDKKFALCENRNYIHPILNRCDFLTNKRGTFFDCFSNSKKGNEIFVSFITESDSITGRRIKQDVEKLIRSFSKGN